MLLVIVIKNKTTFSTFSPTFWKSQNWKKNVYWYWDILNPFKSRFRISVELIYIWTKIVSESGLFFGCCRLWAGGETYRGVEESVIMTQVHVLSRVCGHLKLCRNDRWLMSLFQSSNLNSKFKTFVVISSSIVHIEW